MKTKVTEYLELTDNRHEVYSELRQVRLTKLMPNREWVRQGTLGGWISSVDNLEDCAWIDDRVMIMDDTVRVTGYGSVLGNVRLWGHAQVRDHGYVAGSGKSDSSLSGNVIIHERAELVGSFRVNGTPVLGGHCYIQGRGNDGLDIVGNGINILGATTIRARGYISHGTTISGGQFKGDLGLQGANLSQSQHLLNVGPLGSEDQTAVLYRTDDEQGHILSIGCWSGAVDELEEEVETRAKYWTADLETANLWRRKYVLLGKLCEMTIEGWK